MNFLRKLFTSPEVSDLISSMNSITDAEKSIAFVGKQVYGLQFLEYINDTNHDFHDTLSNIFDIGKEMFLIFDKSIPERLNIPSKLSPIKEKQSAFNKLRKQKSAFEAKLAVCRKNLKEKEEFLQKLIDEKAPQDEINKANTQVKRAESEQKGALFVMVEFSKTFDQEEIVYMKAVYDLLIDPLIEWAESESKQIENFAKKIFSI